jgi:hypothetical protein
VIDYDDVSDDSEEERQEIKNEIYRLSEKLKNRDSVLKRESIFRMPSRFLFYFSIRER